MSIVRRKGQAVVAHKKFFNGEGEGDALQILNGPEEMFQKGRLFNHLRLPSGAEVGWHIHHGDAECYYILKGTGEYSDNGALVTLHEGDMSFVGDGEGHSIKNIGDDELELIALILYV